MFGKIIFGVLGLNCIFEHFTRSGVNTMDNVDGAWIGLAIMAIGTAVSMYGQYQQGQAAGAMGEYNAEVARQEGEAKAMSIRAESRHKLRRDRAEAGSLRAGYGTSNIISETGSPLLIQAELAKENAYDQMEMERQADIATTHGAAKASMFKWEGSQAKKSSLLSMAGTGLSAAGSIYGGVKANKLHDAQMDFYGD